MTARHRFSIDTNNLVYAVDLDAGIRHEISKFIINRAVLCDCVLPVQVLAEFFSMPLCASKSCPLIMRKIS